MSGRLLVVFAIVLLMLTTMSGVSGAFECPGGRLNAVIFRLDDVQQWFESASQRAVIDQFRTNSDALTLGLIASFLEGEPLHFRYLERVHGESLLYNASSPWPLEFASHSWDHSTAFSSWTLEQQRNDLQRSSDKIRSLFGTRPSSFIPPFNDFDETTIRALGLTGHNAISARYDPYTYPFSELGQPFPNIRPDVYSCAIFANTNSGWNATIEYNKVVDQVQTLGYATVMMHGQDFADADTTILARLATLIADVKNAGYSLITMSQFHRRCSNNQTWTTGQVASTAATTSKGTTGFATNITTTLNIVLTSATTSNVGTTATAAQTQNTATTTFTTAITSFAILSTGPSTKSAAITKIPSTSGLTTTNPVSAATHVIFPALPLVASALTFLPILTWCCCAI